jgi:hypothetical protein
MSNNILTIFAGRKQNLKILCKYLQKALQLKLIDEVHFWNNTRNINDENYIKSISNLKRSSSVNADIYVEISPYIEKNTFDIDIRAKNDIHILLLNNIDKYEIVLGGWGNTKSCIRKNGKEEFNKNMDNIANANKFNNFKISIINNNLFIYKNNQIIITHNIINNFEIKHIYFKTGHNSVGELEYKTTKNHGFYLMNTCEKSWKNYYQYYVKEEFKNSIILKCDDDIVFIDLTKFNKYIDFIKNNDYDLVFANTINNGVSAYYQQNKYNLIPKDLMNLEYPNNGLCGSLWESGTKAEKLHNYFIENNQKFLDYNYNNDIIDIKTRFSINFFGFKGKNWFKIKDCFKDDEHILTVDYVKNRGFRNVLYTDFYVAHLSFYKQIETKINIDSLIKKYDDFTQYFL